MNFRSHIFFNNINHDYKAALFKKNYLWLISFCMDVASYCCYEKMHTTMRTATASYFHSFSAAELINIERMDEVFAQEYSYEENDF